MTAKGWFEEIQRCTLLKDRGLESQKAESGERRGSLHVARFAVGRFVRAVDGIGVAQAEIWPEN